LGKSGCVIACIKLTSPLQRIKIRARYSQAVALPHADDSQKSNKDPIIMLISLSIYNRGQRAAITMVSGIIIPDFLINAKKI